jgi:hypothetical protein
MKIRSMLLAAVLGLVGGFATGCCTCGPFCEIPKCDPCAPKCNPCEPCAAPCAAPCATPCAPPAMAPGPR